MYVVNAADLQAVTPGNIMVKYADDTYLVIPACKSKRSAISRRGRWSITWQWTSLSQLRSCSPTVGRDASCSHHRHFRELRVSRRWKCSVLLSMRNYQSWMTSLTHMRGPGMLSVSCVHTACARTHGLCVPLLQQVFQSVVISKLTLHAAPAWWDFSTSADRQRIESFLRRAARSGLWESATTAKELVNCWCCRW